MNRLLLLCILILCIQCGGPGEDGVENRIIYRDKGGNQLSEEELIGVTGEVNWAIVDDRHVPEEAKQLHALARQAGSSGDYEKALLLLERASELAPEWPYPPYDTAFTYLLQGNTDRALEYYERVVTMAPRGFFTALTAVDCLRRENRGQIEPGTYRQFVMLEWVEDPQEKKSALETMLKRSPAFSPGWKTLAGLIDDETTRLAAIEKGLSHHPDLETRGFLLVNKALILNMRGRRDEAVQILGDLALAPDSPLDIEQIAKATLSQILELGPRR